MSRDDVARRQALGAFLRSARARVSPADHGLPPGLRRRTPGLRREEVAHLCGISTTWYTWIEQGREVSVSVDVWCRLAESLRLARAGLDALTGRAGTEDMLDALFGRFCIGK